MDLSTNNVYYFCPVFFSTLAGFNGQIRLDGGPGHGVPFIAYLAGVCGMLPIGTAGAGICPVSGGWE